MVDYDSAVRAVQDPNADPVFLARIAYENPEFGANVAAHERAYPGLLRWIAEFGDDRAKAEAAERGYRGSGPATPRNDGTRNNTRHNAQPAQQAQSAQPQSSPSQSAAPAQPSAPQSVAPLIPEHQQKPQSRPGSESRGSQPQPQLNDGANSNHGNPYGFTVEQALDPHTSAITIAQIAQYAPELRVYLARNPSTYPELLDWLARQHDPQIDAALAERRAANA
ncbi:hypothetical protein BTIS_0789 [Bifidobacterium tissieri]|uniref:Leucine rich repeat variant domain-containing protein n=1 Tax=Bifidobacterium tissieri TaxID=1630162 RepID=A0A261FGW1_9BIFI|nr:hypothetical protein [Bifidobacterium tissieri]OZG58420.1 hypothetical protein BTIS_0789 [Bifidobacterium tissieri]